MLLTEREINSALNPSPLFFPFLDREFLVDFEAWAEDDSFGFVTSNKDGNIIVAVGEPLSVEHQARADAMKATENAAEALTEYLAEHRPPLTLLRLINEFLIASSEEIDLLEGQVLDLEEENDALTDDLEILGEGLQYSEALLENIQHDLAKHFS